MGKSAAENKQDAEESLERLDKLLTTNFNRHMKSLKKAIDQQKVADKELAIYNIDLKSSQLRDLADSLESAFYSIKYLLEKDKKEEL